jgi:hypothetical protein
MRLHALFAATALAMAFALPARAADTAQQTAMKSCAASWSAMSAADKAKTKHQEYMSSCLKGGGKSQAAASSSSMSSSMSMSAKPAAAGSMQMAAPAGGGSAKCKDGTTVTYKHRQGTCSGHGGVASWM